MSELDSIMKELQHDTWAKNEALAILENLVESLQSEPHALDILEALAQHIHMLVVYRERQIEVPIEPEEEPE